MPAPRALLISALLASSVIVVPQSVSAKSESKEGPPACGAISFHPLAAGALDGTQNAGLYRSRFGKLVLRAEVAGGQAKNYFLEVGGKKLEPLKGALPNATNSCLNSKHVKTPAPAIAGNCLGERFRAVLNNTGSQKFVMLFALQGDIWKLCSASSM